MTTDLRAALRDTATAWDALGMRAAQPECDSHPLVNPDHCAARARQLRALADAPPTVAELLAALPDPPGGCGPGAHRVEWSHDDMRFRASRYGLAGLIVERCIDGEWRSRTNLNHADLTRPATLVEVTP